MFAIDLKKSFETAFSQFNDVDGEVQLEGVWNALEQKFAPINGSPLETLSLEEKKKAFESALDNSIARLNAKPCTYTTLPNGSTKEGKARRYLCPKCDSGNIILPIVFYAQEDGQISGAKPGKGFTSCPDCDYKGQKAKVVLYSMYEFADLIRERKTLLNTFKDMKDDL
jgi:hypothetical protein